MEKARACIAGASGAITHSRAPRGTCKLHPGALVSTSFKFTMYSFLHRTGANDTIARGAGAGRVNTSILLLHYRLSVRQQSIVHMNASSTDTHAGGEIKTIG